MKVNPSTSESWVDTKSNLILWYVKLGKIFVSSPWLVILVDGWDQRHRLYWNPELTLFAWLGCFCKWALAPPQSFFTPFLIPAVVEWLARPFSTFHVEVFAGLNTNWTNCAVPNWPETCLSRTNLGLSCKTSCETNSHCLKLTLTVADFEHK